MSATGATEHSVSAGWAPDAFVEHLAAGWQLGEVEAFISHFRRVVHPDIVSRQPLSPPMAGIDAFEKQFRDTFRLLPGVTATIKSWGSAEPNVYVEWDVHAPGGRHPYRMNSLDRFTLEKGLITERAIYFAPGPLLAFIARHPRRWPAALHAR
jgi:hypothetical protein